MSATAEVTMDQVADFLFAQMFADPKLKDVPANERAAYVAQRFNALATEVAEKKAEEKVSGMRTQLTDMQAAMKELQERSARREKWHESEQGFHRGIDGRLQPNVSRETAETLVRMITAMRDKDMEKVRALSSGVGAEGGYTLATEVATEILRLIPETGLYPQIARPWPMGTKKVDVGSVLSQMGAYWPEENNEITASFPTFGKVTLEAKLVGALIPVPLSLLEDATPDLGQLFADLIRECIGMEIDRVSIIGKSVASGGSDTFDGLINAANIVAKVLASGKTKLSDITPDDALSLQTTVPDGARDGCSYLISPTQFEFLRKVKTADGDYINGHFITTPQGNEGWKLWGKPVFLTERLPAFSTAVQASKRAVLYGNFKKWALFGNRKELTIASSDVAGDAFKNVQLIIRGLTRVGIAAFGPALAELETAAS